MIEPHEPSVEVTRQLSALGRHLALIEGKVDRLREVCDVVRRAQVGHDIQVSRLARAIRADGFLAAIVIIVLVGLILTLLFVR